MALRRGAHAGARKIGAYPWDRVLCVFLTAALCLCPLGFAYGQGSVDQIPEPAGAAASLGGEDVPIEAGSAAVAEYDANEGSGPAADLGVDASLNSADAGDVPETSDSDGATQAEDVVAPVDATAPGQAVGAVEDVTDPDDSDAAFASETSVAGMADEGSGQAEADADVQTDVSALANSAGSTGSSGYAPILKPVAGAISLLVVVAGFLGADGSGAMPYDNAYDWAQSIFGQGNSLADYYAEMSSGKLDFVPAAETSAYGEAGNTNTADKANDGIVHVTLPEAHGNWAGRYTEDGTVAASMLDTLERALEKASDAVDFASFDSDGDGALAANELAIAFVVAGYESSLLAVSQTPPWYSLWGHQWSYSEAGRALPVVDGVTVDSYVAVGEKATDIVGSKVVASQTPYSIIAHEMGHVLGLPDLYDTAEEEGDDWWSYTVDDASLMGTGNYAVVPGGKTTTYLPTALDAWSRYQLGWTTPTVVTKSGVYTVSAQDSKKGYSTLLIPTKNKGEYYIIENRTFAGYDAGLATSYDNYRNGGIVIWHIDNGVISRYLATNTVNASTHRPGVVPLYAEEGENKAGDWVYTLDFKTSTPDNSLLFWTKGMWEKHFGNAAALNLPLYGKGKKGDDPVRRLLSGIRIQFLTNAGPDMKIRIIMPGDPLPESPTPKKASAPAAVACDYAEPYVEAIPATGDELPYGAVAVSLASFALFLYARRNASFTAKHARSGSR